MGQFLSEQEEQVYAPYEELIPGESGDGGLPKDVWAEIFQYLELPNLVAFNLVNKVCQPTLVHLGYFFSIGLSKCGNVFMYVYLLLRLKQFLRIRSAVSTRYLQELRGSKHKLQMLVLEDAR
jgi:hypothetical protein